MKSALAWLGRLTPLVRAGLIAGVVLAAVAYPLAAMGGIGAKAASGVFNKLPGDLEQKMTKQQILEGYLNIAYFGHRAYGIFAAADIYFSKAPGNLTLPEAAMIAGLVQAPSAYDPAATDQTAALQRRNWVID